MHDIYGGQPCPTNFKVIVFPLSRSFDEGIGMDVRTYGDLDSCNYITASVADDTPTLWTSAGANYQGVLGSDNLDIISSGNLQDGNGVANLWKWICGNFKLAACPACNLKYQNSGMFLMKPKYIDFFFLIAR